VVTPAFADMIRSGNIGGKPPFLTCSILQASANQQSFNH
jgi:hypothetical protein